MQLANEKNTNIHLRKGKCELTKAQNFGLLVNQDNFSYQFTVAIELPKSFLFKHLLKN